MKLVDVNKEKYRSTLNKVIVGFIGVFAASSLLLGQLLITFFSNPDADNFKFNLLGVVLGLMLCAAILTQLKDKAFMKEVYYVWQLKQVMNKIYRKLTKVKAAAKTNDVNALSILNYYYALCLKVYHLDDNTITIASVLSDQSAVKAQIESLNLTITDDDFAIEQLQAY